MLRIKLPAQIEPYRGILLFAVVLMLSNFFWKYNVLGDDSEDIHSVITFWGMDISKVFTQLALHAASVSQHVLNFFGFDVVQTPANSLKYANGHSARVIWACTGLKQAFIMTCILIFARGSWKNKLWFVPVTLLVVYLFNIFRISVIVAFLRDYPDWFDMLHTYLFKYLFYAVLFLWWLLWEEKIVGRSKDL